MEELPRPLDSFVGRDETLTRAMGMLEASGLLTLWGPAGIGKTRLALEIAHRVREDGGAVVICELQEARADGDLAPCVARQLARLPRLAPDPDRHAIGNALARAGDLTVVLDNAEQILGPLAEALRAWRPAAPAIRWIVTSRERLDIRAERCVEVEALGPEVAARLFVDRASARDSSFAPPAASVDEVVRTLDGIPLAIELAAARAASLGVDGLRAQLARCLDVLEGGYRGAPSRQATLRGALAWSWELLTDAEREALTACAVFEGPFTVFDLGAVLGGDPLPRASALRDKSLLTRASDGRFGMLALVRAYALEHLDPRDPIRARHAQWWSERCDDDPSVARRAPADVLAAIDWQLDAESLDSQRRGARCLLTVEPVFARYGPAAGLRRRLEAAAERADILDAADAVRLDAARGRAALLAGDVEESRRCYEVATRAADALGDAGLRAEVAIDRGVLHHQLREQDRARECYGKAMALERGRGDVATQGRLLGNLGALHHDQRELDEALEHYEEALAVLADVGPERLRGVIRTNLGVLMQERGELDAAEQVYLRARELLERAGDRRLEGICVGSLGSLAMERGEADAAAALHRDAIALLEAVGDVRSAALAYGRLSAALALRGALDEAEAAFATARELVGEVADPVWTVAVLLHEAFLLAARAAHEGDPALRARAEALVERAHQPTHDGGPVPVERSDDVRLALRLLSDFHGRIYGEEDAGDAGLEVRTGCRGFRVPGGEWQDLSRLGVPRRVLVALVEQHRLAPGVGLSVERIQRAVWPGERIRADAAANRVYVAVSKLRRLGLGESLSRGPDGYHLEPSLRVAVKTE